METIGSWELWAGFSAIVLVMLAIDLFVVGGGKEHRVSFKEAAVWSVIWISLTLAFAGGLWWYLDGSVGREVANSKALEFITGYLIEKALAVDNVFIWLMLFSFFAVPVELQKRVLLYGVLGAIIMRTIMIFAGVWLIAQFHWLLYVFAARGYKPGGLNPPGATFAKETVWDFEFGWKSSFLDKHIRTQIGAFYNRYNNFQIDAINPVSGTNAVINVPGTSTIKGLEAQLQAKFGGLSFSAAGAYVDSKLSTVQIVNRWIPGATASLPLCTGGAVFPACFNYPAAGMTGGGGPNLLSPKWTWNASLSYKFNLGQDATIEPRINYSNVSSQQAYLTYAPQDLIGGHSLASANIAIEYQNYNLDFYANNLTKEYYVTGISGTNNFFGSPREFGVRLGVKF